MNKFSIATFATMFLIIFSLALVAQQYSYDYENMTKEEYAAELSKWQKREADAKASISEEEAKTAHVDEQIAAADKEYHDCWAQIYSMIDTDESGYNDFDAQCKALENDVDSYGSLSAEEIASRISELEGYENRLAELRKNKTNLGPSPYVTLNRVEAALKNARNKAESAVISYNVVRGDYLWRIAGSPNIYGDSYAWMRIYSYNRSQIKNPDLIYPNQVFTIPKTRRQGEHWVTSGENLTDIAKSYGNPFTWQRLYEANKEVIGEDANTIYPHMVLSVPR